MKFSADIRKQMKRILAVVLTTCLVAANVSAAYAATQEATATSVKVMKSEGTIEVHNSSGRILPIVEGMRLYHGYQVITQESSYVYMALDKTKLATLDAVSDMSLEKKDNDLILMLNSGKIFFDVSAKLDDEETMNIHTSTVALGIRGTSGLVEVIDSRHTRVWLFAGQVDGVVTNPINGQKKEIHIVPGMVVDFYVYDMSHSGDKCEIVVRNYHESEAPGFVLREMKKYPELVERILQSGGGNFYPYLEDAEQRLHEDEARMHEQVEAIRAVQNTQRYSHLMIPVFAVEDVVDESGGGTISGGSPSGTESAMPAEPEEPVVYETATLLTGSQINQKFQELLNYADSHGLAWNPFLMQACAGVADLKAIRYAAGAPSADQYTVTLQASGSPVYAWYQGGTIYLYSDAPGIRLPADCSGLLDGFYSLTDLSGLENLETSNVTNLSRAFSSLRSLTDLGPVSGWDVSNVTDLSYAFSGCTALKDLSDLRTWDIGRVTDLSYTFAYNTALVSVSGIEDWNTSSVTALDNIFSGCTDLADASMLSTHDAGSYTAWDVKPVFRNVTKAEQFADTGVAADTSYSGYPDWFMKTYRFIGDHGNDEIFSAVIPLDARDLDAALKSQLNEKAPDFLKNWNTSEDGSGAILGGDDMALITEDRTFYYQPLEATLIPGPELRKTLKRLGGSDINAIRWSDEPPAETVTNVLTVSEEGSDRDILCWFKLEAGVRVIYLYGEVKTVYLNQNSSQAFSSFTNLTDISGLAKLDCSRVTDLSSVFWSAYQLENFDPVADWDTSNVTSLEGAFYYVDSPDNFDALAKWDTGNVTTMRKAFSGNQCKDLSGLSNWDTGKVEDFSFMLTGNTANSGFADVDALAGWDTGSAVKMDGMFSNCYSLMNVDGLQNWDVSNVTDLSNMFDSCKGLGNIDGLRDWDTSRVQNMYRVFYGCEQLTDLSPLSDWNVEAVTEMDQMFMGNTNLETLKPLVKWNPIACTDFHQMFDACSKGLDASPLDSWKVKPEAAVWSMFDGNTGGYHVTYPCWYQDGKVVNEQSALTLDAGAGTVEMDHIAPASRITLYKEPQQMSEAVPDPDILSEEYIAEAVELPPAEHPNAVFEEWNTSRDGSGVSYKAGDIFALEGQTTLYAVWEEVEQAEAADATPSDATPSDATPPDAVSSEEASTDAVLPVEITPDAVPANMMFPAVAALVSARCKDRLLTNIPYKK